MFFFTNNIIALFYGFYKSKKMCRHDKLSDEMETSLPLHMALYVFNKNLISSIGNEKVMF